MNSAFFANKGLTSTQASHLADISKELQQNEAEKLTNITFYDTYISVIGSKDKQLISHGLHGTAQFKKDLDLQSSLFTFNAWVREAIKYKDALQSKVTYTSFDDWLVMKDIKITPPTPPKKDCDLTEEDVINSWDMEKRMKYLELETYAAHYGKFIHVNGAFNKARKDYYAALNTPIVTEGSGRDIILFHRSSTVEIDTVDQTFLELQAQHREFEKQLNQMKAEIKNSVNMSIKNNYNAYEKKMLDYNQQLLEYNSLYEKTYLQFETWKSEELAKISQLKIAIPERLKATFEFLQAAASK